MLKPNFDEPLFSLSDLSFNGKFRHLSKKRNAESSNHALQRVVDKVEPLWDRVRHELFNFAKSSLNVDEHRNYARGSVST
jgi:hypothetical protein